MITGTMTEFWIGLIFFFTCNYAILSDFEKKSLSPQLMRFLCISLMVVGGYTTINALTHLDFIGEMMDVWSGEGNVEKMAEVRKGYKD